MKTFFGRVIAVIAGIYLFIFLCFMIFSIFIAIAGLSETNVLKDQSILTLKMEQPLIENLTEIDNSIFEIGNDDKPTLLNMIQAIRKAKDDGKINGISIELDMTSPDDIAQVASLREEIESFKKSGKFVYAYTNRVQQGNYFLSTVADSIFHNPMGTIELKGLSSDITFFKNMGEKYGIEFEVIRHGKYKSAVEPFIRDNLSEENKHQLTEIISSIWNNMANKMSLSRGIDLVTFNQLTDNLSAFEASKALKYQLIDVLAHESEYHDFLKTKLNMDLEDDLNSISLEDYTKTIPITLDEDKIAVLYAHGMITPGDGQNGIQSEAYKEIIKDLADDENVKAVVLRVNSGGGDANTSEEILFELKKLHLKKPVVVSFGNVAASGGYYIAQASDKIFAEPYTITGSIGVLGMIPNAKGLLNNIGITHDYVSTNANSQFYSPFAGLTPHAKKVLTESTENVYKVFITHVANNRNMTVAAVDSLGGGRVYTGKRAMQLGLVDEIGSIEDAIAFAADKAELNDYSLQSFPIKENELEAIIKNLNVSTSIKQELQATMDVELVETYLKVDQLRKLKGAQVLWPYDFKIQ